MNTLILIIGTLALIDLLATPMLLSVIRKNGGFHYLVTTLHKSAFMILVLAAGIMLLGNGVTNVVFQVAFCDSFLFLFNTTFEINDYFLKVFDSSKYSLDGMTEQGRDMMSAVFADMEKNNSKSFVVRFGEMTRNFITNISQDLGVVYMVVVNDKAMKGAFEELHRVLGNDIRLSGMTKRELFFLVKNRVIVDLVVLALMGLVFFA